MGACSCPLLIHVSQQCFKVAQLKKQMVDALFTGVAPESAETGSIKSAGAYVAPQASQLSPYWSGARHFGQVPLINRSARNNRFLGIKRLCDFPTVDVPAASSR